MKKRFAAVVLCLIMALALLPKTAWAAGVISANLAGGDIQISGQPNDVVTVTQNGTTLGTGALSDTEIVVTNSAASPSGNVVNVNVSNTAEKPVKITLDNVTIDADGKNVRNPIVNLGVASQVLLTLKGTNTLKSSASYAAVHVPKGASLTIQGDGALYAFGGASGAGIGGSNAGQKDCGSVTIKSGFVKASGGGQGGAGIGGGGSNTGAGGNGGNGGNITITGGTVVAIGGSAGAGIGGGGTHDSNTTGNGGAGGTVTITGGTIYAWDGGSSGFPKRGAGIGGGGCTASGSGSVGAGATVTLGSFPYEWVQKEHVASNPFGREYALGPLPNPPTAISNLTGFVGIRPPLTISPASGAYGGPVSVTIQSSATKIDFIKYTLDGSDPRTSPSAQTYNAPFTVMPSVQVKAYAEDHDPIPTGHLNNSAVVTAVYTLSGPVGDGGADVPKTGDNAPLAPLMGLILLSGAGLAVSAASRRRAKKRP